MIWAGNVLFPRRYVNEIGFDPNTGFRGEQCHMTLQAFSNGYKLVHPRRIVAYHYNESGDFWTKPYHKPVVSEKKLAEMKEHDETHFQQYLKNLSPEVIEEYRRITGFDYIQKTIEKRSYTSKIGCNYPFKVIDDRI
jgi:hypothetical protein